MRTAAFEAIGTKWRIEVRSAIKAPDWQNLLAGIKDRIEEFDRTYSRFRDDSWVARIAEKPGTYDLPADVRPLLETYNRLYRLSGGAVTPAVGDTLSGLGYDKEYSLKPTAEVAAPLSWESVKVTADSLTVPRPVLLDFGAAGKGYLVDIVGGLIEAAGSEDYVIDAGGDMRCRGNDIEIGLLNPMAGDEAIGTVSLKDRSLAASAGNLREWDRYHHIIDPFSLESPRHILATWVIADDTMTADGLSTALFFASPKRLAASFDFEYAVLGADMDLNMSKAFPARLFTEQA